VLGGFKFAIQGDLRPVYRRPRFDYGEGLLSGPAWAGVLAVLSARRNALRVWLGEGAARSVVVGALAAGLGVQASTTPPVAQSAAMGHTNLSHSSAARQATGGGGLAVGVLKLSEFDGYHRASAGKVLAATEPAQLSVGGGQDRRLPVPGAGAASARGERIDPLSDIGLFDLSGAGGAYSGSRRSGNDGSSSDSGEPGSASDSSFASDSPGWPSDDAFPGAGGFFGWPAGWPIAVLARRAGSGPVASGLGPDVAPRSTRVFEALPGPGQVGGDSAGFLGPASLSAGPPGSLNAPGSNGAPEAFGVPGPVSGRPGGLGGVPEPATWAIMFLGLALVGGSARQRRALA